MGKFPRRVITARACKALSRALAGSRQVFSSAVPWAETLEKRQMMSTTSAATVRAASKLDASLITLYQSYLQQSPTATAGNSTDSLIPITNGGVQLQMYPKVDDRSLLVAALKRLKATEIKVTGREIDAMVPVSSLGKLANVKSLKFAEPGLDVVNSGAVTSQGDIADQAANARAAFSINGAGVKVGIVSDSFNTSAAATDKYANDVASGDLPSNVQILADGQTTDTDEGRAIAQVIYDSAPGASLAFATAGSTQGTFAANIRSLATAGAKVIVDDVTNLYEPMFQDGVVAQAVTAVTGAGVTYISAAGNRASNSYASSWRSGATYAGGTSPAFPSAAGAPVFYGGTAFNFNTAGGTSNMNSFTLGNNQSIKLSFQWDSPYYSVSGGAGSTNQLDAYVLNAAGTQVVGGGVNYDVGGDPIQVFQFTNTTGGTANFNLMLVNENVSGSAAVTQIKYVDFDSQASNWAFAPSSSTIFGHANAVGAETIGAASYSQTPAYGVSPPVLESYSGTGGTPIIFNSAGGRMTSQIVRQEPSLVGPDAVSNTFYTSNPSYPDIFSGTSAAAASVAGVAALILQKGPTLTPAQVDSAMQSTAIAMGGSSPNYSSGYGLVQATAAISTFVANVTGTVFHDNNADGVQESGETGAATVTVFIDSNNNGILDPGEPITTTTAVGTFAFYNQTAGSAVIRVVPPSGSISTVSGYPVTIVAGHPFTGVALGIFPIVFTGTAGGYTYTLQTDPTTTTNLDIITPTITYTAPKTLLPSLTFNLGGGNNTLNVNFSSGSPVPAGGATFVATAGTTGNKLNLYGTSASEGFSVNGATTFYNTSTGSTAGTVSAVTADNVQSEIINGNSGNDLFSVETAQPAAMTLLQFNGGIGNDTLTVDDALPNNGVGTNFNAGTNVTDVNTLNVNVGKFTFSGNPITTAGNLTVNVTDTPNNLNVSSGVIFAAGAVGSGINVRNLTALNITPGSYNIDPDDGTHEAYPSAVVAAPASHGDRAVLVVGSLSVTGNSMLDLNANDMIITSGSLPTVNSLLSAGSNSGNWNGPTGIASSAATNDTTHLTAVGSLLNNNGSGGQLYGSGTTLGLFDLQNPGTSAILLKYTYYGDADLSGVVDGSDYSRTDSGFLAPHATGWANGDFNYDNVVDGSDYTLLDNAFNAQGNPLS